LDKSFFPAQSHFSCPLAMLIPDGGPRPETAMCAANQSWSTIYTILNQGSSDLLKSSSADFDKIGHFGYFPIRHAYELAPVMLVNLKLDYYGAKASESCKIQYDHLHKRGSLMTDARSVSLRFRGGSADLKDLRTEISAALGELADPTCGLAERASVLGFSSAEFIGARADVSEDSKGFGEVVLLITIVAPAATHALNKVWDDLIWPRLKSRLGGDAVGEQENSGEKPESSDE
jgi:hypothetical protein